MRRDLNFITLESAGCAGGATEYLYLGVERFSPVGNFSLQINPIAPGTGGDANISIEITNDGTNWCTYDYSTVATVTCLNTFPPHQMFNLIIYPCMKARIKIENVSANVVAPIFYLCIQ